MKINTLNFFFSKAFKDLRRNKTLTFSYLFVIALTIFMSGLFALFVIIVSNTFADILSTDKTYSYIAQIKFFRGLQFIVFIVLAPISLFLIIHVIKMTVFCRRDEIITMKYLGATQHFINYPFIIEGITLGFMGSVLGDFFLYEFYTFIYYKLIVFDYPISFVEPNFVVSSMLIPFAITGALIGVIGNLVGLKKVSSKTTDRVIIKNVECKM